MAIVRWEPFRNMGVSRERLNRLFNEAISNVFQPSESVTRAWSPAVDIYENDQNVVLKAELRGVDPKDVEVRVENGTLYLEGQRKFESDVKDEDYHRIERSYGSFLRTFSLPTSVNPERVTAEYRDGLLTLTLAKHEAAKPKTIKINVTGEAKAAAARG